MEQALKFSLHVAVLMGLTLLKQVIKFSSLSLRAIALMSLIPASPASAGVLSKLEAQCLCLTEHATLGQLISLGVMLILVTGIIVLKWIYRHEEYRDRSCF